MSEALAQFKYVIFFGILFFGVPFLYQLSLKDKLYEKLTFFFLIFFTARMEDINFVSRETYRITTKGFEIGMVDICMMVLYLLVKKRKRLYPPKKIPDGGVLFILYFTFSFLSIINSHQYLFSFFEIFKMMRMYFFFWIVYNYLQEEEHLDMFLKSIGIIIFYIFMSVLKQKYVDGIFQTKGPFPHQNSLVMYMIVFNSVILAFIINEKSKFMLAWALVFFMGVVSIISTLSRGGMIFFAFSCIIVFFISFVSKFTFKKVMLLIFMILCSSIILYKASDSIIERFTTAPEESMEVRELLAISAVNMANENFFGVGLNNFGVKVNPPYPYSDHIEHNKAVDESDIKNGLVETIYLMIAAESGWHTLGIFLTMLLFFYFKNYLNIRRYKDSPYNFISIGFAGALSGIYLESAFEWVLKQTNNFYQLIMVFAVIASMKKINMNKEKNESKI